MPSQNPAGYKEHLRLRRAHFWRAMGIGQRHNHSLNPHKEPRKAAKPLSEDARLKEKLTPPGPQLLCSRLQGRGFYNSWPSDTRRHQPTNTTPILLPTCICLGQPRMQPLARTRKQLPSPVNHLAKATPYT